MRFIMLLAVLTLAVPALGQTEDLVAVDARQALRLLARDLGLTCAFERGLRGTVAIPRAGLVREEAISRVVRAMGWRARRVEKVLVVTRERPHTRIDYHCLSPIPFEHVLVSPLVPIVRKHWPGIRVQAQVEQNVLIFVPRYHDDAIEAFTFLQFMDSQPDVR